MALNLPLLLVVSVSLLILMPVGILVLGSFSGGGLGDPFQFSLKNYLEAFTSKESFELFFNTLSFSVGTMLLGTGIATVLAWLIVRTNTPMRRLAELIPIMPLVLPPMMDNIAWIFLTSPRAGILNKVLEEALGLQQPLFNSFSLPAMIWVMSLSNVPLAYLIISAALTSIDPSLEESSDISGASRMRTFTRITFPLVRPAIFSAGILVLISGLRAFETPTLMGAPAGIDVYVSRIYDVMEMDIPPNTGLATAYASLLLVITTMAVGIYVWYTRRGEKFRVITGKAHAAKIIDLGRWRWLGLGAVLTYFIVAVIIPFSVVGVMSFMPYFNYLALKNFFGSITSMNYNAVVAHPFLQNGLGNSAILGTSTATIAVLVGAMTAYIIHKSRIPGRKFFELIGTIPIAFPGLILGLGLLWAFYYLGLGISGGLLTVQLGLLVFFLPYALRATSGAIVQIHSELEEASLIHGASWSRTFRSVTLPLLKPALASGFIYIFIQSFREVGAVIFLARGATRVASVALFEYYRIGEWMNLAAGAVVYALLLLTIVLVGKYVFRIRLRL